MTRFNTRLRKLEVGMKINEGRFFIVGLPGVPSPDLSLIGPEDRILNIRWVRPGPNGPEIIPDRALQLANA